MKVNAFLCVLALVWTGLAHAQRIAQNIAGASPRETYLIDKGWKFHRGHLEQPNPHGHHWVYKSVKAGAARGPAAFNYDDKGWRTVDLPHDYVVEGGFVNDGRLVSHGFHERPEGWYRRSFRLSPEMRGKTIWLYFDGVFGKSQVWVNGQELRRSDNGYIGFRVNISDVAHYGDRPNVISVMCDPGEAQGWWYEGGGIYRHVWLTIAEPVHVAPYGVYVNASKKQGDNWCTQIEVEIENEGENKAHVQVVNSILDHKGAVIFTDKSGQLACPAGEKIKYTKEHLIPAQKVKAWSVEQPNLYGIRTEIFVNGKKVDAYGDKFGFRTLEFNAQKGFLLNGKPVKFKGVCMHQDHAGVGVALPDAIHEFRVRRLKQFGCNAYRCSHNPPATEILEACDKLGMLVVNENRFFNASEECLRQLDEQVRRDRNHPSVIMWSTFNEEDWQGDERGVKLVKRMKRVIDAGDHLARRPVTGAMSAGFSKEGAFGPLDVLGINYALGVHDHVHNKLYPGKMIYSSESVSHSASRGEWRDSKHVYNNYDNHWVAWGDSIRNTWRHVDSREWDAGTFIWTGFDYRGEPTPVNAWPVINSYFGIVDTCGFAKDSYYLLKALWEEKPMAYVFPHWNLGQDMVGKKIKVGTYTNGDEAELVLNGKSLGKRKVDKYMQLYWDDVVYHPGTLKMIAYKNGKKHAEHTIVTTGEADALGLEVKFENWKRKQVYSGINDAVPVTVFALDKKKNRVPTANNKVSFHVQGGRILGVGNGNPLSHEPDIATERCLYNGLASAIIEPTITEGEMLITATADGLAPCTLRLPVVPRKGFAQYPTLDGGIVLTDWRMAEITPQPQNPNRPIADGDMNTWQTIAVGNGPQSQWSQKQGWTTYRALVDMPKGNGWVLSLDKVVGEAEVFVNGKSIAKKTKPEMGNMIAPVQAPAGSKLTISVHLKSHGEKSGLIGTAKLSQKK